MAAPAKLPQLVDVLRVERGLRKVSEADHLGNEQRVACVGLRLADVEGESRQVRELPPDGGLEDRGGDFPEAIQDHRLKGAERRVIYVRKCHCNLSLPRS